MDFDPEENLPAIYFDKEKMRRVIVNLMDNALQAVNEREAMATDEVYEPVIKVVSKSAKGGILIKVVDNGIGMTAETIDRAFEPLFTTRARGTGLGLANVSKIIEEHNGSVSIESIAGGGVSIKVILPIDHSK